MAKTEGKRTSLTILYAVSSTGSLCLLRLVVGLAMVFGNSNNDEKYVTMYLPT